GSGGGDDGTTPFRSGSSDEDGGNQATIAASGSKQSNRARLREQQAQRGRSNESPEGCRRRDRDLAFADGRRAGRRLRSGGKGASRVRGGVDQVGLRRPSRWKGPVGRSG